MRTRSHGLTCSSRFAAALVAVALCALLNRQSLQAATTRIPATYYPAGATITYRPAISNHQMDCLWGFFCEGHVSLFHSYTQNQLHRVGGWGQFAGLRSHGRMVMAFELFASRYKSGGDLDGTSFAKEAFDDLLHVIGTHGYTHLGQQPRLLPAGARGDSMAEIQRLGSSELVVMACWSGTQEVESIVLVDHGSASVRRVALLDLTSQMLRAAGSR